MKYYIYDFMLNEMKVPGVYQEGTPEPGRRPAHYIDVLDDQFGTWIKEMSLKYDVMLLDGCQIWIDVKGKKFRQR